MLPDSWADVAALSTLLATLGAFIWWGRTQDRRHGDEAARVSAVLNEHGRRIEDLERTAGDVAEVRETLAVLRATSEQTARSVDTLQARLDALYQLLSASRRA